MDLDLNKLDNLFKTYGYEVRVEDEHNRAYLLRQGMYFGAEIISNNNKSEFIYNKYKESDYACKIENFNSIDEAETYLFNGFFHTGLTKIKINSKYDEFASGQVRQYKDPNIKYEYIKVPFNCFSNGANEERTEEGNLIEVINDIISQKGAYLIIVEAAAGFGKTCTAYELYKSFERYCDTKRPFFTELTRNRTSKLFKYVLRDEIEHEYGYGINTDLVLYNIKKGKIPFIIDGFDELLSKDIDSKNTFNRNEFEEVETMLSTIGDLLKDDAKIILTSRKTAIFAGEDFNRWMEKYGDSFTVVRFQLNEPKITHWLTTEKVSLLNALNVPISLISSPVILTYLRNIDYDKFCDVVKCPKEITNKYFESLLEREKIRQDITISVDDQLLVFKNLAAQFYKYDVNSEERNMIKFLIELDNKDLLTKYGEKSTKTVEELLDTLTNHALLDRHGLKKNKEYIGFINDFVMGYLVGKAIIDNPQCLTEIKDDQLEKVFCAFKYCGEADRTQLWNILNGYREIIPIRTRISLDLNLTSTVTGKFENEGLDSYEFSHIDFTEENVSFKNVSFTGTQFKNCRFEKGVFKNTYFTGCTFTDCSIAKESDNCQIHCYGCEDFNSKFVSQFKTISFMPAQKDDGADTDRGIEELLLAKYFKVDKRNFKMKLISTFKDEFSDFDIDQVYDVFHQLKKLGYITQNGNNSYITKKGSNYYHKKYGNV